MKLTAIKNNILLALLVILCGFQNANATKLDHGKWFLYKMLWNTFGSGGNGNYANSTTVTTTICPATPSAFVRLSFTMFATEGQYDDLTVYDGVGTGGPVLGAFDGTLSPFIVQGSDPSGCLTLVFSSDGSNVDAGFEATFSCHFPCQSVIGEVVSSVPASNNNIIEVCKGASFNVNGNGLYPSPNPTYNQSNATSSFQWDMGNGDFVNGQNISYTYNTPGVYDLDLRVTDSNGCTNTNDVNYLVRVSSEPKFDGTNVAQPDICLGQSNTLTGYAQDSTIEYFCYSDFPDTTFVPDGVGVSYTSSITLDCFDPATTLQNVGDLISVCLDLEHSYIGDLELTVTCPNGASTDLYISPLAATNNLFLGEPVDDENSATFGDPYSYCFTMTAAQSWLDVSEPIPPPPLGTIPTYSYVDNDGTAVNNQYYMPPGDYLPDGDFSDLNGCPLNGSWVITVTDLLGQDNGAIFNWGLDFNPSLYSTADNYTPAITDTMWVSDPTITSTTFNQIVVTPTSVGQKCYTYRATDEFGCDYDTVICFNVAPPEDPTFAYDQAAYCDNVANPTPIITGVAGGTFSSTAGLVINATTGEIDLVASTPGNYVVTYSTPGTGCLSTLDQNIAVHESPSATISGDATLCEGQTATITIDFLGTGPWDVTYSDGTNNNTITGIASTPYTFNTSTSGTYTLVSVSNSGCSGSVSGSATVVVNGTVAYSNVQAVCDGTNSNYTVSFELSGGDNTTYNVTGMNGGTITNPSAGVYLFTSNPIPAGTINYSFSFQDGAACNVLTIDGVQNCNCPATAVISGDNAICTGDSALLTVTFSNGTAPYSFTYTDGTTPTTVTATINNPHTFYVQVAGNYSLTSFNDATCQGSASGNANVTSKTTPTVDVEDFTICDGESQAITATPSVTGGVYTWTPGAFPNSQTITVSPNSTQYYYVEYDVNGCTDIDSSLITVDPTPTVMVNDAAVCDGNAATLTAVPSIGGGVYS